MILHQGLSRQKLSVDISGVPAVQMAFVAGWGADSKNSGSSPSNLSGFNPDCGAVWWKVHSRNSASSC